jgi:hypothetical protein
LVLLNTLFHNRPNALGSIGDIEVIFRKLTVEGKILKRGLIKRDSKNLTREDLKYLLCNILFEFVHELP